ncbi:hypothetical protein PHYPSEUDO_013112 [Phytophthora pseudosyringae]|uniref:Uncharacterized protein n=1 Tax=Phytophthora pseudosyringae TaxID=221518 RepID=A0A8T1V8I5_9STRA|nr:hypothetical protein PHYPSEUDO_013112 [Phytophthora pseudosyringae]
MFCSKIAHDSCGPTVKEVRALGGKWSELDAKLAAATPQAYYDRVLRKLECTGEDTTLLLEALNESPVASAEHGMGEASTGGTFTLRERALPTRSAVEQDDNGARMDSQSVLET